MKKYQWSTILFLGLHLGYSQECHETFNGQTIDFHDNTPLEGSTIQLFKDDKLLKTVYSDETGKFSVSDVCGITTIIISHDECDEIVEGIEDPTELNNTFYLEHHTEEVEEVIVLGHNKHDFAGNEVELNKQDLINYSDENIGAALKNIVGVESLNTGNSISKPIIHGLHSSRVGIFNNGVRLEDQQWGVEHAPNVDANIANTIKVVKGAKALQYSGDAVGGVVLVKPQKLTTKDTVRGRVITSGATNGRGGGITGDIEKGFGNGLAFRLQGSYKKFGDYEAPDYVLSNTGSQEKNFSALLGFNKLNYGAELYYSYFNTENGILYSSHVGNIEDLYRAINADEPSIIKPFTYSIDAPRQETTHHLLKAKFYKRFQNFGKLDFQYSYQLNNRQEFDRRRNSNDNNRAATDLELTTHTADLTLDINSNDTYNLKLGSMFQYQENVPDPNTGVKRLIPDYQQTAIGLYALGEYDITSILHFDAGLRYDYKKIDAQKFYDYSLWEDRGYQDDFGQYVIKDFPNVSKYLIDIPLEFNTFSATAGLNWDFSNNHNLDITYSLAERAPNPSELFSDGLHHSAAAIEIGDIRLNKETSHQFAISYLQPILNNKVSIEISPYANIINDYMMLVPTGVDYTVRGSFPVWEYKQIDALIYGIDLYSKAQINSNWQFMTKFSYLYGEDKTNDQPIIDMSPSKLTNSIRFEKPEWKKFYVQLDNQQVFKQNRFPDNNFNITVNGIEEVVDLSTPPGAYNLTHLTTGMAFNQNKLAVNLSVQNLFNESYRDYLNRMRYYADDLGRNIKLNIQYKF